MITTRYHVKTTQRGVVISTKQRTYVDECAKYHACTKFESSALKMASGMFLMPKIINRVSMHIFNELQNSSPVSYFGFPPWWCKMHVFAPRWLQGYTPPDGINRDIIGSFQRWALNVLSSMEMSASTGNPSSLRPKFKELTTWKICPQSPHSPHHFLQWFQATQ